MFPNTHFSMRRLAVAIGIDSKNKKSANAKLKIKIVDAVFKVGLLQTTIIANKFPINPRIHITA